MTSAARLAVFAQISFVVSSGLFAQEPPFSIQGPGINPADFRLTKFATGIGYPVGMVELDDGSILVAETDGSSFFTSNRTGRILRFVDADQDGEADDDDGDVVFDGLVGGLSALRRAGDLLVCTGQSRPPITILRLGDNPSDPLTQVGEMTLNYPPGGWLHPHSALGVRQTPGETDRWDIVFQLGSDTNFAITNRTVGLTSDIGISGTLNGDAVHMVTIHDTGSAVVGESLVQLATGLRNAAGFAFHSDTGDLYIQDNGIDGLQNANEPHSADELNVIPAADIGGDIEHFGFPGSFERYRTQEVVGGDTLPLFAFHPLPDPQTGQEGEGPNDIVFAPSGFPAPLNQGIFVTMHGKFGLGGLANEENPLIFANLETGDYFHFVGVNEPGVGHLDGLLATNDSIFIADISPTGGFGNAGGTGVIYQLQSSPAGERPEAIFTIIPQEGDAPLEVCVDASASTAPDGVQIIAWDWDFSGTPASGASVCHTFQSPGSFEVTLTVTADDAKTSTTTQSVIVNCAEGEVGAPWERVVLGTPTLRGASSLESGVLTLCGGGDNLAGATDAFQFVYQAGTGDAVFSTQIEALEGALGNDVVGLMIRESLDPDARFVTSSTRRGISERYAYFWRPETGGDATFRGRTGTDGPPNNWVRLDRQGDEFSASSSSDGVTWEAYGSGTLEGFSDNFVAGFFLVSDEPEGGSFEALTARFANFELTRSSGPGARFIRGDCDGDGNSCTGVNDALVLLNWLFQGSAAPGCIAACNADGVGDVQLTDAVFGLNFCFGGFAPPPAPHPDCGVGELPEDEAVGCASPPAICN